MDDSDLPDRIVALVGAIRPLLSGQPPEVVGPVLADLLATWIGGHIFKDDPKATAQLHQELLHNHIKIVDQLVPVNAAMIHNRQNLQKSLNAIGRSSLPQRRQRR